MSGNKNWGKGIPELGEAILAAYPTKDKRADLKKKIKTAEGRNALAPSLMATLRASSSRFRNQLSRVCDHPSAHRSATREALAYVSDRLAAS